MANYPVGNLSSIEDCDAMLSIADKEQKDLDWKKLSLQRQKEQYTSSAFVNSTELATKTAELSTLDTLIAGLPEGLTKTEMIKKRTAVWYRVFLLENRQTSFGDVALLEKEYELNKVQNDLDETALLIAQVTARKDSLSGT